MTALVTIDPDSSVSPSEQLRVQLSRQVRSGSIEPGARLPTVRQLAADLGLAKNTVVRAYRAMEAEGLVIGARRKGTIVLDQPLDAAERERSIAVAAEAFAADLLGVHATLAEAIDAIAGAYRRQDPSTT